MACVQVRSMRLKEYLASQQQLQEDSNAGPSAAAAAARVVDSKLEAVQQESVSAATAAPTTRSLRSRARSATAAAAATAEPRTTRSGRSRTALPAAVPEDAPLSQAAAASGVAACAGGASVSVAAGRSQLETLAGVDSPAQPQQQPPPPAAPAAAATKAAAAGEAAAAKRAAAQAKVDAKLAAIGLAAAGTAARGADRTVLRQPKPGETFFSKNGERIKGCLCGGLLVRLLQPQGWCVFGVVNQRPHFITHRHSTT